MSLRPRAVPLSGPASSRLEQVLMAGVDERARKDALPWARQCRPCAPTDTLTPSAPTSAQRLQPPDYTFINELEPLPIAAPEDDDDNDEEDDEEDDQEDDDEEDPNANIELWRAINEDNYQYATMLIESTSAPNVDYKDIEGKSLLEIAMYKQEDMWFKLLIEAGADPNTNEKTGNPLLYTAVRLKKLRCLEMLLYMGADPNINYSDANINDSDANTIAVNGWSVLMYAVTENLEDFARALVDAGAKLYVRDNDGNTAAMLAAQYQYKSICEMLHKAATEQLEKATDADLRKDLIDAGANIDGKRRRSCG